MKMTLLRSALYFRPFFVFRLLAPHAFTFRSLRRVRRRGCAVVHVALDDFHWVFTVSLQSGHALSTPMRISESGLRTGMMMM